MKVCFFEGINGIGKTSLINAIQDDDIAKELFNDRSELALSGQDRIDAIWESSLKLFTKYRKSKKNVLINRSYLSEIVYSQVLNRKYSLMDMSVIMHMWAHAGNAMIIYLQRDFPLDVVLQRRPQFNEKIFLRLEELYDYYIRCSDMDIATVRVGTNLSETLKVICKIIKNDI